MACLIEEINTESPNTNENVNDDLEDVDMIDVMPADGSEHCENNKARNKVAHREEASSEDTYNTRDHTSLEEKVEHTESASKGDEISKTKHSTRLPMSRIKYIMKADEDCSIISQDAVYLVTKATEMFIESIAKETMKFTTSTTGKRKVVSKKEVDSVIDTVPHLCFLDGIFE